MTRLLSIVSSIGPKLRELRLQRGMSLQQLAAQSDVSAAAIHKIERGGMVPTTTTPLKIAVAFNRPVSYFVEEQLRLADELTKISFADRLFFCNSGSEANEAALKLARRFSRVVNGELRNVIVSTLDSFHGRSFATVAITGQEKYRQEFGPLLDAGIDIWNYQRSMLHAKVMTVDGCVATVGSGNLDQRSMRLNDECNLLLFDRSLTAELDEHFADDLTVSERLDPDRWEGRGTTQRAKEAATDIFDHKL